MLTVRDVMSRSVVSVHRRTPLKEVAQALIDNRVSGVPVVDVDGAVVGVVSEADLLIKEQGAGAIHHRPLTRLFGESRESRAQILKVGALNADEAMTAPAITITSDRSIHEAAAIMTAKHVNRLPVVDEGRLVGIVSRADLVRAYVRTDDDLAATIRQEVLLRILWLDPVHRRRQPRRCSIRPASCSGTGLCGSRPCSRLFAFYARSDVAGDSASARSTSTSRSGRRNIATYSRSRAKRAEEGPRITTR